MPQFTFQIVHEDGLGVRIRRAVGIEHENAVMFDQDAKVEKVDEDG